MNHFRVTSLDGAMISDNLAQECQSCLQTCFENAKTVEACPKYGGKRKQGKSANSKGTTFLCCAKTKTTKLFRNKLEGLSYAFHDLVIPRKDIEDEARKQEQQKVNRLVHNLTSINAHNIQEIYDFVPQSTLASHWRDQLDFIEREVKRNPKVAAMMFLRMAKNNIHMKSEFSIYRKLDREDSALLEFQSYSIRNLVLNVLHTFFSDFTNNNILVNVSDFHGKVKVDYETIQVAIYHMIENASKYAKPNSKIVIEFSDEVFAILAKFSMTSTYVKPNERNQIFEEGYSGEVARKMGKQGDGIGMWRIQQMMKINNGFCIAHFSEKVEKVMGFEFSENEFILKFMK